MLPDNESRLLHIRESCAGGVDDEREILLDEQYGQSVSMAAFARNALFALPVALTGAGLGLGSGAGAIALVTLGLGLAGMIAEIARDAVPWRRRAAWRDLTLAPLTDGFFARGVFTAPAVRFLERHVPFIAARVSGPVYLMREETVANDDMAPRDGPGLPGSGRRVERFRRRSEAQVAQRITRRVQVVPALDQGPR